MSCLYPVRMFRLRARNPITGKNICVHNENEIRGREVLSQFKRPCQYCIECRLAKSRETAVRLVHESTMYDENSYLTLTYDDSKLPSDLSLSTRDMQLFWKRLRRSIEPKLVKYYASGEYGDGVGKREINPHYHACLFGHDFPDKKFFKKNENGDPLYTSEKLSDLWGNGFAVLGDVTFESAAYVARYTMKKVYGKRADGVTAEEHYAGRLPEQSWCSNGLGETWFLKYKSDVYPHDHVVTRSGIIMKPPKFYDKLLLKYDPKAYEDLENLRAQKNKIIEKNNFTIVYDGPNNMPMTVSEVVRSARLRVGKLDLNR